MACIGMATLAYATNLVAMLFVVPLPASSCTSSSSTGRAPSWRAPWPGLQPGASLDARRALATRKWQPVGVLGRLGRAPLPSSRRPHWRARNPPAYPRRSSLQSRIPRASDTVEAAASTMLHALPTTVMVDGTPTGSGGGCGFWWQQRPSVIAMATGDDAPADSGARPLSCGNGTGPQEVL